MTKKKIGAIFLLFSINSTLFSQDNAVRSIKTKKYDPTTNLVFWPDEFNPTTVKLYVYNEIEINTKPEVVWNILIDAKKWHHFYDGVQSPVEFINDTTAITLKNSLSFKMHISGLKL